jgi:hypothetical protein
MPVGHRMHGGVAGPQAHGREHDVTTIGEDVELHGGGSEKLVAQVLQISPFDNASEHPAVFAFLGLFAIRVE